AGINLEHEPLDTFEKSIIRSILGECALALENHRTAKEREETAILARNEQLKADLLRSISHDLRTPLTSISGNAAILLTKAETIDAAKRQKLYADIYDDSLWLIDLVENLLSITRMADDAVKLHLTAELIDEVIAEALNHVNRRSTEHHISVRQEENVLIATMDVRLIVQVIINIVENAIKYTPKNSEILITATKVQNQVLVEIFDQGEGIPDTIKPKIFEMFYTAQNRIGDSRRSLGLGLALSKSIITAHGGSLSVRDNTPYGSVFSFTLPAAEVTLHE
ncbi:MAG: ATP-binding protein, partial [Clostridiales bacterium]